MLSAPDAAGAGPCVAHRTVRRTKGIHESDDIFLRKSESEAIMIGNDKCDRRLDQSLAGRRLEKGEKQPSETFCTQPETRVDFLYFFARNPLKSPDSDE